MTTEPFTRFWSKYIEKIKYYGSNNMVRRWHVRSCEDYIRAYKDTRLTKNIGQQVADYRQDLGRKTFTQDWHFL